MLNNPLVLKTQTILIMFSICRKPYTDCNKLLEYGMRGLANTCSKMILKGDIIEPKFDKSNIIEINTNKNNIIILSKTWSNCFYK